MSPTATRQLLWSLGLFSMTEDKLNIELLQVLSFQTKMMV